MAGFQEWLFRAEDEPRRKEELDQWFTDPKLAEEFVEWCQVEPDTNVIEPTAGCGNLVKPLLARGANVVAYELDPEWVAYLRKHFPKAQVRDAQDFLAVPLPDGWKFDLCSMNPPLSGGMDGVFLRHLSLYWAERTCAIVQTRTMHSGDRRKKLWDKVQVTRIEFISDRPSFGRGSPMRDFSFVEIRPRQALRQPGERDSVQLGFL
jgi:predicted RNA methylase